MHLCSLGLVACAVYASSLRIDTSGALMNLLCSNQFQFHYDLLEMNP